MKSDVKSAKGKKTSLYSWRKNLPISDFRKMLNGWAQEIKYQMIENESGDDSKVITSVTVGQMVNGHFEGFAR